MIAYPCDPVKTALDISLGTNKHAVADLKCLQMQESYPGPDSDSISEALGEGSPNRPPHQSVQLPIPVGKPGVLFQESCSRVTSAKMAGKIHLKIRIRSDHPQSMNRGN